MNIAIITGASSGMGRDFVYQIAKKTRTLDEIWVIARRKDRLEELSVSVTNVKIRSIPIDITDKNELDKLGRLLQDKKPTIRILVNSAGYGMIGKFAEIPDDNIGMCNLNCVALTGILNMCIPYMNQKRGNIINLASSAGFLPQPSFAVYAATKAYVLSLSIALGRELANTGIKVTAVCPGPVSTEFFGRAETYHQVKLYKKLFYANSSKVVALALRDSTKGKPVSVYGVTFKGFRLLCKILPQSFIIKFIK